MRPYLALVSFLIVAAPMHAGAVPVLDQACCATLGGLALSGGDLFPVTRVQGFTVGLNGQLTGIELGLFSETLTTFELYDGHLAVGDDPSTFGAPRATLSLVDTGVAVPGAYGHTFFFADLTASGIAVTAGQQFSIFMRPGVFGGTSWAFGVDQYTGGSMLTTLSGSNSLSALGDASFRTYVDNGETPVPTPVPEPGTLLLMGSGAAVLWRRRQS